MIHDGLWCPFENWHMGNAGETVADVYKVTRDQQDQYSADSHKKAAAAQAAGKFTAEILAGHDPAEEGRSDRLREGRIGARRHHRGGAARPEAGVQEGRLGDGRQRAAGERRRRGAGRDGGGQDAGRSNAKPMARIVAQATSGLAPKMLLMTPVEATRKVLKKAGWSMDDVDLLELNEAFAVQAVAVGNELGVDLAKVNVNGGAVALGHPIGASGARILTTLIYALKDRGLEARHRDAVPGWRERRRARHRNR